MVNKIGIAKYLKILKKKKYIIPISENIIKMFDADIKDDK